MKSFFSRVCTQRITRHAFTLVEVTLALGVASFALVAIFGLLPVGLTSNQNSYEQTAAASIAVSISADLRTAATTAIASPLFAIDMPTAGTAVKTTIFFKQDGSLSGTKNANADPTQNPRYRATIVIKTASTTDKSTAVRILITWPALADKTAATDPVNFSGSLETLTMLDRN
ncbi:MAG: hypothetical protein ABIT76_00020 [Chthoniobacterales bacterium]